MRRRSVDSSMERQFLTALIVSKPFLAGAMDLLKLDLIRVDHFRTVAGWCLGYFKQYGEAPGKQIESMYNAWVDQHENKDLIDVEAQAIGDLLEYLSDQYDTAGELNVPYLLDQLGKYLSLAALRKANDQLTSTLAEGDVDGSFDAITNVMRIDPGGLAGIDPFHDRGAWARAFADPLTPLIEFGGDAGDFFNQALTTDALVGIQAPEKTGKTWMCMEMMMRGLRTRRKVAMFQVGDLTEAQFLRRLGVRLAAMPMWKSQCGPIRIPNKIQMQEIEGKYKAVVSGKIRDYPNPLSRKACVRACRKFLRGAALPTSREQPHFMLATYSNSTINVRGIENILDRWEQQKGFVPDVVIIDYADILAPEDTRQEFRHQVNDTWKAMRRLSQERRCLVLTATQASASSYEIKTQGKKQFSEDKRKYAHVTAMLGLNQSDEEKKDGIMRLNWIVKRESAFSTPRCLYVAQCLPLGRAICCARYND